jgi:hypothetical protein
VKRAGILWANATMIREFKASWPCHGLPDDMASLQCEFASNGDIVALSAFSFDGETLDTHDFDGAALSALVADVHYCGTEELEP